MKLRNLLAEKDMYHMFEFTFLRQQVLIVREVTKPRPKIVIFGRNFLEFSPTTRSGETLSKFIRG